MWRNNLFYRKALPMVIKRFLGRLIKLRIIRFIFLPLYPLVLLIESLRRRRGAEYIKRILIINFGAIGDNLMSTPTIRALNEALPNADITIMTGSKSSTSAYINSPRIKRVFWLKQFNAGSVKYAFEKKYGKSIDLFRVFISYPLLVIRLLLSKHDLGINFCAF